MLHSTRSVFCIAASFILVLSTLGACRKKSTESPINGSHVKVKLLNKDCMGYILAILDPRYASWGQADYELGGQVYTGVAIINGQPLLDNLNVNQEYYVDIQPISTAQVYGACFRAPGPPAKLANITKVY
ncbi:MAG TPA: hypothetical protein VGE90_11735 [Chitinophaga sp.]